LEGAGHELVFPLAIRQWAPRNRGADTKRGQKDDAKDQPTKGQSTQSNERGQQTQQRGPDQKDQDQKKQGAQRDQDQKKQGAQRGERDQPNQGAQRGQEQPRQGAERDKKPNDQTVGQGSHANISTEQCTRIRQAIVKESNAPRVTNVNFTVSVGTVVPRTVRLAPIPVTVIEVMPAWRGYEYFLVGDDIIVVEPGTLRIVAVIPA
jgi:hypothetical protein